LLASYPPAVIRLWLLTSVGGRRKVPDPLLLLKRAHRNLDLCVYNILFAININPFCACLVLYVSVFWTFAS
jgi:hypothetical protein